MEKFYGKRLRKVNVNDLVLLKKVINFNGLEVEEYDFAIFRVTKETEKTSNYNKNGIIDVKLITGNDNGLIYKDVMAEYYAEPVSSSIYVQNLIHTPIEEYNGVFFNILGHKANKVLEFGRTPLNVNMYIRGGEQVSVFELNKIIYKLNKVSYQKVLDAEIRKNIKLRKEQKFNKTNNESWKEL